MGGALEIFSYFKATRNCVFVDYLAGGVVRCKNFVNSRYYQQSRPFELWIPGEALPTLRRKFYLTIQGLM